MTFRDPHSWMWAEALGLLEQADRLRRQFFIPGPRGPGVSGADVEPWASWEPPVDVLEYADRLEVIVALPGVAPESIQIESREGALKVIAQRGTPQERRAVIRRLEIPYGRFERRLPLPAGTYELAAQSWAAGCLHLTLLKR